MEEQVSVSIIVPVYKAESFLRESICSILNQTFENFELILVEDGSPDGSGKICDELASCDKRVRVIHKENGGQSSARNAGIEVARGKYLGFMDNDDFMYPDMCKLLFANAEKYGADISAGSYIVRDEANLISHNEHSSSICVLNNIQGVGAYLSRELVDVYVWTKFYRRDFLNKYHIRFEEERSDEDFLFNYQAFSAASLAVMEDIPVYIYIERQESTCRTFFKKNLQQYLYDTRYRLEKIENEVIKHYPDLLYLSKRQTIRTCFRMIFVLAKLGIEDSRIYYLWIKRYLYLNARTVIRDRKYWGMTLFGCILAAYMSPSSYFMLKKWKHRNEKL